MRACAASVSCAQAAGGDFRARERQGGSGREVRDLPENQKGASGSALSKNMPLLKGKQSLEGVRSPRGEEASGKTETHYPPTSCAISQSSRQNDNPQTALQGKCLGTASEDAAGRWEGKRLFQLIFFSHQLVQLQIWLTFPVY